MNLKKLIDLDHWFQADLLTDALDVDGLFEKNPSLEVALESSNAPEG